jgi:hypothetical protein
MNRSRESYYLCRLTCPLEGCDRKFEVKFDTMESKQTQTYIRLTSLHLHKSHGCPKREARQIIKDMLLANTSKGLYAKDEYNDLPSKVELFNRSLK